MAKQDGDLPKTTAPTNNEDAEKVEVEPSEGAAPTVDAEPAPAEGDTAEAEQGEEMIVVLTQHYTDDQGINHLPESELRVSADKARSLIASGWATEKTDEPEDEGDQAPEPVEE